MRDSGLNREVDMKAPDRRQVELANRYHAPRLRHFGSVRELTRAAPGSPGTDSTEGWGDEVDTGS